VFFPAALRSLAGGLESVEIDARSVRELLHALESRFPDLQDRVREGVALAIDGEIVNEPWLEPLGEESEVHFLPPISGG
jgi:molybdopterin converting factor small subunit